MKKILIVLLIIMMIFTTGCSDAEVIFKEGIKYLIELGEAEIIDKYGEVVSKSYALEDFHSFDVKGSFDITLTKGNKYKVEITSNEKIIESINAKVNNGVLEIYWDKPNMIIPGILEVAITCPSLKDITLSNSTKMILDSSFNGDYDRRIDLSNSSNLKGIISGKDLTVILENSSDLDLNGSFEKVKMDVSNSAGFMGHIKGETMDLDITKSGDVMMDAKFTDVKMNVQNSGDFEGDLKGETLSIESSNSAEIDISGEYEEVIIKASNSCDVNLSKMTVSQADVDISKQCEVTLGAETINLTAKNSSELKVINGKVNIESIDKSSEVIRLDE